MFREFCDLLQSEYSFVLYHYKVRWLNARWVFERIWDLKVQLISYKVETGIDKCEHWKDIVWLSDLPFFQIFSVASINWTLKFQGRNQLFQDILSHIRGFKIQLKLFSKQQVSKDYTHIPRLKSNLLQSGKTNLRAMSKAWNVFMRILNVDSKTIKLSNRTWIFLAFDLMWIVNQSNQICISNWLTCNVRLN